MTAQGPRIDNILFVQHPDDPGRSAVAFPLITGYCIHCKGPFTTEQAYGLGAPYYGLLHVDCAPLFNYSGRYPHKSPLQFYYRPRAVELVPVSYGLDGAALKPS